MPDRLVTACAIVIGNEILSGRTQDANIAYLGERLNALGVRLMEARVIPDIEDTIVATVNEARARFDYVFTTGGIGPTHDDITAAAIAKAFGVPLVQNPEARAILEAHYPTGELNRARLRMANTPEGAALIENPVSKAPGFQMENVFVMAGIPSIMRAMFESLSHRLAGGTPLQSRSVTVYLPESRMAPSLSEIQDRFPDVEIGSYPFSRDGRFGARLVLRSTEDARLAAAGAELETALRELGGEPDWD
jgi:molybdenum cofactor synthesis domain-containing protein